MTARDPTYRTGLAVAAVVVAVLALSLGDAIIKGTGAEMPLWQMYILRSLFALPVLWWLACRKARISFNSLIWVVLRSVLLVAMWLSYYSALPLMPLSLAAAAYYTSPIMITVLTALLARQKPTPRVMMAVILGFGGVVLVLRPNASSFDFAALLPVLAAFLYACAMVLTSLKCRDDNPFALALALNIAFIIAGVGLGAFAGQEGSFMFGPWQNLDLKLIGTVTALSAVILVGSVGTAIAYQNGPPATVSAFDYSYLVFSLIWGALYFAELPDVLSLAGIVVIVLAGFLSLPREERHAA
ncbi:DMT family transporter [Hoeflea prorocentri]|uniref:DMT family transporter n=1 Tax=Hoeflea prorocentri TaxID=1922333 RepID=A0A9X3ZKA8_9HYPH|nr:DMT family transporter [Hoeflea prorocentri]MCY6383700.1 DMT family transporter [Hoeflea prorocentri]MDA5401500.1 DMT family transporter [Hoeflea prorocentri]